MFSPNISIATANGNDCSCGSVWGLLDVVAWLLLFLFTFLDWLLLPKWPSFNFIFFLSFLICLASILSLSHMNLLMILSCTLQHDGCLSFFLQDTHCVGELHEGGTSLGPK